LIKYIKSVIWRVAKCLSYIEEARCLKVKCIVQGKQARVKNADLRHPSCTVVKTQICVTRPQCVKLPEYTHRHLSPV